MLNADLDVVAVLAPGGAAPRLVTRDMVREMKHGSMIVDVSINSGGCCETSRPTSHADPTYAVDEGVHYCVTNMPGALAGTSTQGLNNATPPFVLALADKGYGQAMRDDLHLRNGLDVCRGGVTCDAGAASHNLAYADPLSALAA